MHKPPGPGPTTPGRAAASRLELTRIAAAATLVSAATFVADNLLHAQELSHGHAARQLVIIADHPGRWQLAHALGFATIAAGGVFIIALTILVARERPRAAVMGGSFAVVGLAANAFLLAIDGYAWGRLGGLTDTPGIDSRTLADTLAAVQESAWISSYQSLPALLALGLAVLVLAALRIGLLTRTAAVAYLFSVALLGLESVVHSNVYFVLTALAYLAGGVLVAIALLGEPGRRVAAVPDS